MSESAAVRGILFAHGRMAEGMTDAVRCIAGVGDDVLVPLSNEGKGPEALIAEIERLAKGTPVIVFTDLQSGSCALAARVSSREHPERAVLCGVNLPMLLDFVFHRDLPLEELVERLLGKGHDGMVALQAPAASP